MKKRVIILLIILCVLFVPKIKAASFDIYTVKSSMAKKDCPVRSGAGTDNNIILNGNDKVYVYANQTVDYLGSKEGYNNGKKTTWYAIKFDYAAREYTGYVVSACFNKKTYSYNDDSSFEESIKSFPDSYKPFLRRLHAIHPNWNFKPDFTNLDFYASISAESQKYQSAISYLYPSLFYRDKDNPNGIIVDGKSWYAPCFDEVAYYLDPRNFLTDKNIFMFESLIYNAKILVRLSDDN